MRLIAVKSFSNRNAANTGMRDSLLAKFELANFFGTLIDVYTYNIM